MHIRDASAEDFQFIVASNAALASETEKVELDRGLLEPGVREVLSNPALGRYYIAEAAGQPVGQLMVTFEWSDWRNGLFWWIQSVFVSPAHRGQGVFAALFRHLEQQARADPRVCGLRLYVDHSNERALEVYNRLGLHKTNYGLLEQVFRGPESHHGG